MKNSRTEIDDIVSYGYDIKRRIIYFGEPLGFSGDDEFNSITQMSVDTAIRVMDRMESDYNKKPITIKMSTYGGDVYAALRLIDYILSLQCKVVFEGSGLIASSGVFIMSVCDERILAKNTTIMAHGVQSIIPDGPVSDIKINADETQRLMAILVDIIASNSIMPKEFWQEVLKRDLYLTSEECVLLGIADVIKDYKKRGNLRQSRERKLKKAPAESTIKRAIKKIYQRIDISQIPEIKIEKYIPEEIDENLTVDETPTDYTEQAGNNDTNSNN